MALEIPPYSEASIRRIGNGVELLKLHAFHRLELVFQLVQRQYTRLAFVEGFGHQLRRQHRHRQALNGKRFDIDFTIASGNLLQTHTDHHTLVARVNGVEHRITDTRFQLTVQTFIARTAGGPGTPPLWWIYPPRYRRRAS